MSLVWSFEEMEKFFKNIPCLFDDEVYIALLFARRKYYESLSRPSIPLNKCIIKKDPCVFVEYAINKIFRASIIEFNGIPLYFDKDKPIPIEACSIYIDLNPKSIIKGFVKFNKEMIELIYEAMKQAITQYEVLESTYEKIKGINTMLYSAIHRSNNRKEKYLIIDIDAKDEKLLKKIIEDISPMWITETRGGYHIIVSNRSITKNVYEILNREEHVEIKNAMTPIPGTLQGGFKVREYKP